MKRPHSEPVSRSAAIKNLIALPALASALAAGATRPAFADMRSQLKYQSTPKGDQKCSLCTLFVAGATPSADGTCKVIPGPISPKGWCTAFTAKAS